MPQKIIEHEIFEKIDQLAKGDYEYCHFKSCDFSNADLSEISFLECEFAGCNLSMATLTKASFRNIKFKDCKMLGLHFGNCNQFTLSIHIDNCILNYCSFYQAKLKKTMFSNTTFLEADFTETDLTSSVFDNCDLSGARFENTILEKADLRSSFSYSIDPDLNRIKKAKFSLSGITGLLDKHDIEIE